MRECCKQLEGERQLQAYFNGERQAFDLPLDAVGTPFQLKVWEALRQIPYGETRSYKDIAIAVENPKGVRAIGMANNRNPISIITPCHRVIGTNGKLVGYAGGLHPEFPEFITREGQRLTPRIIPSASS